MNAPFNPAAIIASVQALLHDHPELEDDEALRVDMLEGCTTAFEALARLLDQMQETTALMHGLNERIKEMRARRDRLELREESLRRLMKAIMDAAQLQKVALPEATLSIRDGPPKVVIVDETDLPPAFVRVKKEPDRRALLEALKSGETVLGAVLANPEPVLSVRTS